MGRVLLLLLLVGAPAACGSDAGSEPEIRAEEVWSRPAAAMGEMSPGQGNRGTGAVYMRLVNTGRQADRLAGAQTGVAEAAEIHETTLDGDVMGMRHLPDGLEIPAQGEVQLKPGGYHVMLIGLKQELQVGDTFAVVLAFEKSGSLTVEAQVRQP